MDATHSGGVIEPLPRDESTDLALVGERVRLIEAGATVIVGETRPANTRRAFAVDWEVWTEFCRGEGIPTSTVSAGVLVGFVTWLAHPGPDREPSAPATITRRLSGIMDGWKNAGLEIPKGVTTEARRVIDRYEKFLRQEDLSTGRGASPALTIPELRLISAVCGDSLPGLRDRAILVLGFSIAARRAILSAMNYGDVQPVADDGLLVKVRDDKTGYREVAVPYGSDRLTCPVRTWRDWTTAAGITSGRAFRRISLGGKVGPSISGDAINDMIQRRGREAELPKKLTAHSMRSGLATEARRAGKDAKTIGEQGGWKPNSAVLYGYMQIVDRFKDNAAKGIGL